MSYFTPVEIGREPLAGEVVRLRGCDDMTEIPAERFTDEELDVIRKLARLCFEYEGGGCKPTVHLGRYDMVTMQRQGSKTDVYTYEDFRDETDV